MVSLGKEEELPPERSNPLHNFKMPRLKWGSRKVMRCMKVDNSSGQVSEMARGHCRSSLIGRSRDFKLDELRGSTGRRREILEFGRKSKVCDDGIEAVREKLMFDFQVAADEMKDLILRKGLQGQGDTATVTVNASSSVNEPLKPWNLRTRRAACKPPLATKIGVSAGNGGCGWKSNFSPLKNERVNSAWCLRGSPVAATGGDSAASIGEKRERERFSVSLSRQEIEDDFMAITGHRLPRRPKKRPKAVQKQLDMLFPGLWLSEICADLYKVPDVPDTGKMQ